MNVLKKAIKELGVENGDVIRIGNQYFTYLEKTTLFKSVESETEELTSDDVEALLAGDIDFEVFKKSKKYSDEVLAKLDMLKEKVNSCTSEVEGTYQRVVDADVADDVRRISDKVDDLVRAKNARLDKEMKQEKFSFWCNIGFLGFVLVIALLTMII